VGIERPLELAPFGLGQIWTKNTKTTPVQSANPSEYSRSATSNSGSVVAEVLNRNPPT
jgi:hypothetical protein